MPSRLRHILPLLLCIAASLIAVTGLSARRQARGGISWEDLARKRKADYIFMEAMRINSAQDRPEDYFATIRRASSLDTSDVDMSAELGYYEWAISEDSLMHANGITRLKKHFLSDPADFFWSSLYATAARRDYDMHEVVRVEGILDSLYPDRLELSLRYSEDLGMLGAAGDTAAFNRALQILQRIERGVGKEPWLVTRKVRLYSGVKDTVSIMNEIAELLADNPKSSTNNLIAGSIFAFFNLPDSARRYYDLACQLDSTNAEAVVTRAEYFRESGDSAAYDREVFNALKLGSLDPDTKIQMLTGYVRELYTDTTATQRQRINDLFGVLLSQHPHEAGIHAIFGSYLAMLQKFPEAAEQFRYATDLDPNQADVWRYYVSATAQAEDYTAMIEAASRASEFFPDEYWWYLMKALGYANTDRTPQAIETLDSVLATKKLDASERSYLLTTKGDLLYKENPGDTTVFANYDEALQLDPTNFMAMNNLSYFLAEAGQQLPRALVLAEKAMTSDPENPTFIDTYAWALFKNRKYEEAKEYIDRALSAYADDSNDDASAEVLEHAGDIYYMCGEPDKAKDFWKDALAIDPDNDLLARKVKTGAYLYK